jgi:hypothetical protein
LNADIDRVQFIMNRLKCTRKFPVSSNTESVCDACSPAMCMLRGTLGAMVVGLTGTNRDALRARTERMLTARQGFAVAPAHRVSLLHCKTSDAIRGKADLLPVSKTT